MGQAKQREREAGRREAEAAWFWGLVALAGFGWVVALLLARQGVDPGSGIFCYFGKVFDCDAVRESDLSRLAGVSNAVWALGWHTGLIAIVAAALGVRGRRVPGEADGLLRAARVGSAVAAGYSAYLAIQMVFMVGKLCLLCVVLQGCNVAIFAMLWWDRLRGAAWALRAAGRLAWLVNGGAFALAAATVLAAHLALGRVMPFQRPLPWLLPGVAGRADNLDVGGPKLVPRAGQEKLISAISNQIAAAERHLADKGDKIDAGDRQRLERARDEARHQLVSLERGSVPVEMDAMPMRGSDDAALSMFVLEDLEAPGFAEAARVVDRVFARYRGQLGMVHAPGGTAAGLGMRAGLAFHAQDRYFALRDWCRDHPGALTKENVLALARRLKMDVARVEAELTPKAGISESRLQELHALWARFGNRADAVILFPQGHHYRGPVQDAALCAALQFLASERLLGSPEEGIAPEPEFTRGAPDPEVTVVLYADFNCPGCRLAQRMIRTVAKAPPVRMAYTIKQVPADTECFPELAADTHPTACEAARAALAAAQQGRFWDMHDALFALDQADTPEPVLFAAARRIGLDMTRFAADYPAPARLDTIRRHIKEALAHRVNSTPVLFLNNRRYRGPIEPTAFRAALHAAASLPPATSAARN